MKRTRRQWRTLMAPPAAGTEAQAGGPVPSWSGTFIVPPGACTACQAHIHYRCVGGDPLQEPPVDCPCDCGHFRNQMLMNARAWDDMARHVPWLIWKAVQRERLIAGGVNICGDTAKIRAAHRDGTL